MGLKGPKGFLEGGLAKEAHLASNGQEKALTTLLYTIYLNR